MFVARLALRQTLRVAAPRTAVAFARPTACSFSTHYAESHEWINADGVVGISEFAQAALGDVVFVDLPEVGDEFEAGDAFGNIDSVKATSEVYCPVSGTVVAVNENLSDNPGLVNESPGDEGWFMKIEVTNAGERDNLLDEDAYATHCENEAD